jgi:hypothetical protein
MTEADSSSKAHVVQVATEVAELARSGRLQTEKMVLYVGHSSLQPTVFSGCCLLLTAT